MYLISGATGQIGGALATHLLQQKQPTRVLVRSEGKGRPWADQGADVAIGTFEDVDSLGAALEGVGGAFLMQPNDFDSKDFIGDGRERTSGYLRALDHAGRPRVALLSSVGAHHATGHGPVRREHHFERAFAEYADVRVVRGAYFMENWANVLDAVRGPGILPTFLTPGKPIPMVSANDLGRALARALTDERAPRLLELAGPADYTPEQVASALGELLERDIKLAPETTDAVIPRFTKLGFTEPIAALVKEMYEGYSDGTMAFEREPARGETTLRNGLSALLASSAVATR
ncbi:MAG: NmrA family NAD(P)-binding protein [Myxococcota bacterium]